eukprot:scaffold31365_cov22-Tisochrysis_lutea.AAC.2
MSLLHHTLNGSIYTMHGVSTLNHGVHTRFDWLHTHGATSEGEEEDDSRGLIAASSYLDMLTDKKRNRAYRVALENVLASPKYQHQPRILDIGTGTGLLALMVGPDQAQASAQACSITLGELQIACIIASYLPDVPCIRLCHFAIASLLTAAQVLRKQRSSLQQQAQQHGETSPPVVACEWVNTSMQFMSCCVSLVLEAFGALKTIV